MDHAKAIGQGNDDASEVGLSTVLNTVPIAIGKDMTGNAALSLEANGGCCNGNRSGHSYVLWVVGGGYY